MAEENTKEIICPYCQHEFSDSWEHISRLEDGEREKVECRSCENTFEVEISTVVSFYSYRLECRDDKHDWIDVVRRDYDASWILKHHQENPRLWAMEDPYSYWIRDCKNCEESEVKKVAFEGECPWEGVTGRVLA